ncbi:25049_t:CDS:1, partial [Racocetra persica]
RSGQQSSRGYVRRNYDQSYNCSRISVVQSDFNFETSNAKCNKKNLVKEVSITSNHDLKDKSCIDGIEFDPKEVKNNVLMPLIKTYYDKVKSFFNNISCEIIDRLE